MVKKRDVEHAVRIGRSMAAETLKRRRKATATRNRALAAAIGSAPEKMAPHNTVMPMIAPLIATNTGVLVAEGDSWFDYPFNDVLIELEDRYGYDVESVAHRSESGDDICGAQLDSFARVLEKTLRNGSVPKAILFSGGGDDVAGHEFTILLNHAAHGTACLNDAMVAGIIDERVHDAFATALSAMTAVSESQVGRAVPIVVHGCDLTLPDGRGMPSGCGPLPGLIVGKLTDDKANEEMAQRRAVVVKLIDRFNAMLQRLASHPQFTHVRYLDLGRSAPEKFRPSDDWRTGEPNPLSSSRAKVAAKFAAILQSWESDAAVTAPACVSSRVHTPMPASLLATRSGTSLV